MNLSHISKGIVLLIAGVCAQIGGRVWGVGVHTYEGYFAPVYSPDGQYVYFVERRTTGTARLIEAPGWIFGGVAKFAVSVGKDTFSLNRLNVQSSQIEELIIFSPSPIEDRSFEASGSPFHVPCAQLRFIRGQQLEFTLCLTIYQVPQAKTYSTTGVWSEAKHAAEISRSWVESYCQASGNNEWPLFGDWELMEVQGKEYFPAAIVAYNHVTSSVKVLIKNKEYDRLYPRGVPLQLLTKSSKRESIERTQAMLRTHEELVQKYKAMGLGEVQALLRAGKDMQRLGYWPKTPTIVARRLSRNEAAKIDKGALFSIAKEEMESGIFLGLEKAIASPGEEIDHDTSGYYTHRDYTTSARLNAYLKTGKTQFYVKYLGQTYKLTIKKPEPIR